MKPATQVRNYGSFLVYAMLSRFKQLLKSIPDAGNSFSYKKLDGTMAASVSKKVAVSTGFLMDRDGADEPEFEAEELRSVIYWARCY